MKFFFGLLVLIFSFNECNKQHSQLTNNQELDDMIITYEATTRGFYEKIWITKDSVSFTNERNLKTSTVSECKSEDWKALISLVSEISLEKLSELEAPSKMHQVDGAAMATLKVELNNENYETNIFDHGHPPKAISQLVKKVLSIKDMVSKH